MLRELYNLVSPWASSGPVQIYRNRIVGRVANYLYPLYCRIVPVQNGKQIESREERVIVSLTSFPGRIDKLYLCINSLLRQTYKPSRLILWLARSQFPDQSDIPSELLFLQKFGLEIKYCDDIRSYKKVFYTAQEFQEHIIVTADDDTLYPENWLEGLIKTHKDYPNSVCCYRAHRMVVKTGGIAPYSEWIGLSPGEKGPDKWLVPIGVGGVLYPAGYFRNVKFDYQIIQKLCPTADDLWLKAIGLKNGYDAVKVIPDSKEWFTILTTQTNSLMSSNVGEKMNDVSMKNLIEYYKIELSNTEGDKCLSKRVQPRV